MDRKENPTQAAVVTSTRDHIRGYSRPATFRGISRDMLLAALRLYHNYE
jgi:hypothetical protein